MDNMIEHDEMSKDMKYPERIYFRNSIVLGSLPRNYDVDKLFSFDNAIFWKLIGKRVIPDLQKPYLKAVIFTYDDEESARACYLLFQTVSNFTLYDGLSLFYYCRELELTCDSRSRNVYISGIDFEKTQETYLNMFQVFGPVSYFEFCTKGDIPNVRVEYVRATSAFVAVLSLQGIIGRESVINLEMSLFPILPVGSIQYSHVVAPTRLPALYSLSANANQANPVSEGMREQAIMLYTTNVYQHEQQQMYTNNFSEYLMEAVSFGVSRKLLKEKVNCIQVPRNMADSFEKSTQDHLKRFLQSAKKKCFNFNTIWNEILFQQNFI